MNESPVQALAQGDGQACSRTQESGESCRRAGLGQVCLEKRVETSAAPLGCA